MVMTGRPATGSGPGRGWLAGLDLPAVSWEIVTDALAVIDGLAPVTGRIDGELHARAKADVRRPARCSERASPLGRLLR
jgi:hypothetical protein